MGSISCILRKFSRYTNSTLSLYCATTRDYYCCYSLQRLQLAYIESQETMSSVVTRVNILTSAGERTHLYAKVPFSFCHEPDCETPMSIGQMENYLTGQIKGMLDELIEQGIVPATADKSFELSIKPKKNVFNGEIFLVFSDFRFAKAFVSSSWAENEDEDIVAPVYRTEIFFNNLYVYDIDGNPTPVSEQNSLEIKFMYRQIDMDAYEDVVKEGQRTKRFAKEKNVILTSVVPAVKNQSQQIEWIQELLAPFVTVTKHAGVSYPRITKKEAAEWHLNGQRRAGTLPPGSKTQYLIEFAPGTADAAFAEDMLHNLEMSGIGHDGFEDDFLVFFSRKAIELDARPRPQAQSFARPSRAGPSVAPRVPQRTDDGWNVAK